MPSTESAQTQESRIRWVAAATLALVLAAHTLLETGRDALFLANIPAERLPWMYIAAAVLALWVVRLVSRGRGGRSAQARLISLQLVAAGTVFGFWQLMGIPGPWLYYALYIWSGCISAVVVVSFWMLLGDIFTITEGKRFYASIAIGGALGPGASLAPMRLPV